MDPNIRLGHPEFRQAVSSIQKRAERIAQLPRVRELYVSSDLWDRVGSTDCQLILGRRGTGKTHLLRAFYEDCVTRGSTAMYIDCTSLSSGLPGQQLPADVIAAKYFAALLNELGTYLHDLAIRMENADDSKQEKIERLLVDGLARFLLPAKSGPESSHFNYPQVSKLLAEVISRLGIERLYVICDEWANIPYDAQPFVAEYMKRTLNVVPTISLKLSAVNYQCQLSRVSNHDLIGMARGADITDTIDMDRYLIPDEKLEPATKFFAEVLFNHIGSELGWKLESPSDHKERVIQHIFTQRQSFTELVRAAEGNCRDFLGIFARAYFDEFRGASTSNAVSKPNIVAAAISWFDSEKAANIKTENDVLDALSYIMERVLKRYKARTFLVESGKAEHPRLIRLLNERVLHRLNGTYSHADRPGVRYDLFTVDYGAYVRFRGTINAVKEEIFVESPAQRNSDMEYVPVDDKRSIRRIVFDPEAAVEGFNERYNAESIDLPLWKSSPQ